MSKTYSDEEVVRYLLDDLEQTESLALEEAIFSDEDLFQAVGQIENHLIDQYVRGRLSSGQRRSFETNYLRHPLRTRRVQIAQALCAKTQRETEKHQGLWRRLLPDGFFALKPISVFAFLLVLMAGGWAIMELKRLQNQLSALQGRQEKNEQLAQQLEAERKLSSQLTLRIEELKASPSTTPLDLEKSPAAGARGALASLVLLAGASRAVDRGQPSDREPTAVLFPQQKQLLITLKLGLVHYQRYTATLQTALGEVVHRFQALTPGRNGRLSIFQLRLPTEKLESRQYTLIVEGVNDQGEAVEISNELFRIKKQS